MPLNKQNISIPFAQGLDTKTDPKQVQPGKLVALQNAVFTEGMALKKRNGYQSLTGNSTMGTSGNGAATFQSELVSFGATRLNSYNPETKSNIPKGFMASIDIATSHVYRSGNNQTTPNSAYNAAGRVFLHCWTDSVYSSSYSIVSQDTGAQIVAGNLAAKYIQPRAFALGNFLVLSAVDNSTSPFTLTYFYFSIANNTIQGPVTVSGTVSTSATSYDGIVFGDVLYFAWNGSDAFAHTTRINNSLTQTATTIQTGVTANKKIVAFTNTAPATQKLWIAVADAIGNLTYYIQNAATLSTILAPTLIGATGATVVNLIGYAVDTTGFVYYEIQNTYSYSTVQSNFINYAQISDTTIAGTTFSLLRGASIFSKVFVYNGRPNFVIAYGPQNGQGFEPTYFVIEAFNGITPIIIGKLAYTNGGGYQSSTITVNQISASQFQFDYLFKDLLESSNSAPNNVYTQTGVNSAIIDFDSALKFQTTELGNSLNINGGLGLMYDGATGCEQNFNLFPEDCGTSLSTTGAALGIGLETVSYAATYEWTDNQGNIHRSAPSPVFSPSGTLSSSAVVTVSVPTCRLTNKANVNICIYRTAPTINVNTYYRVNPINPPIINSTSADSISFTDNFPDSAIIGNELLYTTGGVVENSGGPAASALNIFNNRLMVVAAEDRNTLWYSKQVLEATPVEMSDLFTLFIDPRFGGMTALAAMDDKEIIFKANAIFYLVGQGPDSTGANNDFSDAVFITSVVGTTNPKSIVLSQRGLMFQSNKGIWLLDRNLQVSYIGAPVEAFNSALITSAVLVPNTTQVRLTLDSGIALVYDYYYDTWGTFTGVNAASSVIFQGLHTYISPGSNPFLYQEAPGVYSDNNRPILLGLTTAWISMAGFQGFERAFRLYFIGQYKSPHQLLVSMAYDFNPNPVQTAVIFQQQNAVYGGDPYYGSGNVYGGIPTKEQFRVNLARQKCQSIQVTLQEALDTSNYVLGAGVELEAIGFLIGTKLSYPKLPATQSVT